MGLDVGAERRRGGVTLRDIEGEAAASRPSARISAATCPAASWREW
jgi:hypothetical protein